MSINQEGHEQPKTDIGTIKAELQAAKDESELAAKQAETARAEKEAMEKELKDLRAQLGVSQSEDRTTKEITKIPEEPQVDFLANHLPTNQATGPKSPDPVVPTARDVEEAVYLCGSIFDEGGAPSVKRLWPNGQILTYRFIDGHPHQHAKVTQVVAEWSRFANIMFRLADKDTAPSLSTIIITFKHASCWSYIGTDILLVNNPPFTMALGAVSDSLKTTHDDRAIILHQFGHALGLVHEHMCPSEIDAVALKQDVIAKYYASRYPEAPIGKYFDTYANGSVTNYVAPDLSSVMVYAMPGEFNEGDFTIELNSMLSPMDKAFMVINYPRSRVHYQASEWTLRHALLIANVDENTSRAITEEHDLSKRRILFAEYLSAARKQHSAPLVDPAPKIVLDLTLPTVQDALRVFFNDSDKHAAIKELRADSELMQELKAVLDRLASYHAVREVVQRALPTPTPVTSPPHGGLEVDDAFTDRLVELVASLYTAARPHDLASSSGPRDTTTIQVDAVTALCNELAYHTTFRRAMERALEKGGITSPESVSGNAISHPTTTVSAKTERAIMNLDDDSTAPDVSAIIEQLSKRPAVLQAVRQALVG